MKTIYLSTMIIFLFLAKAFAIQVPDTGQTECFNMQASIPCPSETEPFYGQDAQFSINPKEFVKLDENANPLPGESSQWVMVQDVTTGLIWEVKTNDNSVHDKDNLYKHYSLQDQFIKNINNERFGGFSDWRIPELTELITLVDIEHNQPAVDPRYFPNTMPYEYWTETLHSEDLRQGWCVSFFQGNDNLQSRQSEFHVRAVRGKIYYDPGRFLDNGDGTITDTDTGFMWQKETVLSLNWADALDTCKKLELGGYSDWRLPGREVLRSIVDYSQYAASLNKQFFPQSTSASYWTSTTDPQYMDQAWCIHFQHGSDLSREKIQLYAVRAVRGGQNIKDGHIQIQTPLAGSRLNAGKEITISWDTAGIDGMVDIELSRFGGIQGSFEAIVSNTPNDGHATWIVSGEISENCVIQIIPKNMPQMGSTQGMFSIDHFSGAWVDYETIRPYGQYRLMLMGQYTDHTEWIETQWQIDPVDGVSISGNIIESNQNNWCQVYCQFEGLSYSHHIPFFLEMEIAETEPNDVNEKAILMDSHQFYSGFMGQDDIDIFKIATVKNTIIQLAFLPTASQADYRIRIFDEFNKLIYERNANDASAFNAELGLIRGHYFILVSSNGDISPNNPYTLSYIETDTFESNTILPIQFGETLPGRHASLIDTVTYTFSLTQATGIICEFIPPKFPIEYDLQIKNAEQEILAHAEKLVQHIHMELLLNSGDYSMIITPKNQVDWSVQFRLFLEKSKVPIENENNQTFETAVSFDDQLLMRGSFPDANDIDFFMFEQNLPSFRLLTLADSPDNSDTRIRIYKDNPNHATHQFYVKDGTFFSTHIGLSVGRYYLELFPQNTPQPFQHYTLALKAPTTKNSEIEPNNSASWCNAISNHTTMHGMIYPEADADWHGFHMESNGQIDLTFESQDARAVFHVSLMGSNNNEIASQTVNQGYVYTGSWQLNSGDYYILVTSDTETTGEYQFWVNTDQTISGLTRTQSISIMNGPQSLDKGSTLPLSARMYLSNAEYVTMTNVNWFVLDDQIATIDANGVLTTLDSGETTVIVEHQGKTAHCRIAVEQDASEWQDYGQLILIAGAHESQSSSRFQTTQYLADLVYQRFLSRQFRHDDIFYFNATQFHDLDGDGYDDNIVDISSPTIRAFIETFNQIKDGNNQSGPLYIYFVGPGSQRDLEMAPNELINDTLLSSLMYEYMLLNDRQIILVLETPKAGQFANNLNIQDNHLCIVPSISTITYTMFDGRVSFTQLFLDKLWDGKDIDTAFTESSRILLKLKQPFNFMQPAMLPLQSDIPENTWLSGAFSQSRPTIQLTLENLNLQTVAANTPQQFTLTTLSTKDITNIYSLVHTPDYLIPEPVADFEFPDTHLPNFSWDVITDTDNWQGMYEKFIYSGRYWIDLCVMDIQNHLTVFQGWSFTVNNGLPADIDFDGMPDVWEDRFDGLDKNVPDAAGDLDNDALNNLDEYLSQCDPINPDTDHDGIYDGWEVVNSLDPIDSADAWLDTDNDNVVNLQEYIDNTDPQDQTSFVQHYGSIRGEIFTDLVGYDTGIMDATIVIIEDNTQTVSRKSGAFEFKYLPFGHYTLQISAKNFKSQKKKIFLNRTYLDLGKIRLLHEAAHPECDYNENDMLDLGDIIQALQRVTGSDSF